MTSLPAQQHESLELRVRRKVAKQLYESLVTSDDTGELPPLNRNEWDGRDDDPQAKRKGLKRKPQSPYTFQNFLWIAAAFAVTYFTDFTNVVLHNGNIRPRWFYSGVAMLVVTFSIACFLIVYLSVIKKVHSDDWEKQYPAAIPIATASFAFGSFSLTVALWPLWGVFTIPILFTQFMGMVVVIAMFK